MLHALQRQRASIAQTYVAITGQRAVGYYSLVVGSVTPEDAPDRLKKGILRHPNPAIVLARLAVDPDWQGRAGARPIERTVPWGQGARRVAERTVPFAVQ